MSKQATPGPWIAGAFHVHSAGTLICDCVIPQNSHLPAEEKIANIRLIAAAPALLGALEAAYSRFFTHDPDEMGPEELRELESLLRAAIDLARGEGNGR